MDPIGAPPAQIGRLRVAQCGDTLGETATRCLSRALVGICPPNGPAATAKQTRPEHATAVWQAGRVTALLDTLKWQFRMTWSLADRYWLPALTDELLVWTPTPNTATMRQRDDGRWMPDWDEDPDPVPPASAGWLTWHIKWWWTRISAAMDDAAVPEREQINWEPDADQVRHDLGLLAESWRARLAEFPENALEQPYVVPWPEPRPARFGLAWVNSELMKNVAEIGDVVRLHNGRA